MKVIKVRNWEAFEKKVTELRAQYPKESWTQLFRGQGNSKWKLRTTLERSGAEGMLFRDYLRLICSNMRPEVRTFAHVDVPVHDALGSALRFLDSELLSSMVDVFPIELYRYMAYLRHFAFPSPLLDWSRSPFVAAFFAFRDDSSNDKPKKRSIFAYFGKPAREKGGTMGSHIRTIGPYVETHERHFRQRCDYTICGSFEPNYGWRFDSHQTFFDRHLDETQDRLWRFDLPSTERTKVLRALGDYNLNAFSLFGSEESLLETLWLQEYVLRGRTLD
jgi:hypothetical protein